MQKHLYHRRLTLNQLFQQRRGLIIVFSTFNWIMAFLTLGMSLAVFILLLARQQDAHNNCIVFWNTQGGPSTTENSPSPFHSSVPVPGNQQSIEDYCNNAIRALIIAAGVCTFVGNGIQVCLGIKNSSETKYPLSTRSNAFFFYPALLCLHGWIILN